MSHALGVKCRACHTVLQPDWCAGIYCADCAVTERSARIAETAPEEAR